MCWGRNYLCQYKTIKNAQKFTKEGMLMINIKGVKTEVNQPKR